MHFFLYSIINFFFFGFSTSKLITIIHRSSNVEENKKIDENSRQTMFKIIISEDDFSIDDTIILLKSSHQNKMVS